MTDSKLKALILVAGIGRRMMPITQTTSKSLLKIGDKPLLWYSIYNLQNIGVNNFVFVVGHKAGMIRRFVQEFFPDVRCEFVFNDQFSSKNSIYSFYVARNSIVKHNFFRLAGDLLYTREIAERLLTRKKHLISAVEHKIKESPEEFSVRVNQNTKTIVEYGKHIQPEFSYGEAQGIDFVSKEASFSVYKSLEDIVKNNLTHEFPEYAFQNIINQNGTVYYQDNDATDFWCEVDTKEDLLFAKNNVHKISKQK